MKPVQTAKAAAKVGWDTFEELKNQTAKPMMDEVFKELGGFGSPFGGTRKTEMAKEDLKHAREEKKIEEMKKEEEKKSKARISAVRSEYQTFTRNTNKEQQQMKQEVSSLQEEVVQLAKAAGVNTKVHMEQMPKKIGIMDIKRLTSIVSLLRIRADSAKSGSELVSQRSNAKRATGMMAWVSGKQMKIHEQGTLQLQG